MEIKASAAVPTDYKYKHDPFNRKDKAVSDLHDYRWLTEFDNSAEIPHGTVTLIKKANKPGRADVTMLYLYDAICYTKLAQVEPVVLATQRDTGPVNGGIVVPLPNNQVGAVLDGISSIWGYSATTVGMDIESIAGGSVTIAFSSGLMINVAKASSPRPVFIRNLEPASMPTPPGATVKTPNSYYGRGDFYQYYELFSVTREPFHMWERFPLAPVLGITGDCNGGRASFSNLDDLL